MARLRKCKLVWAASDSQEIVGYKVYWAYGSTVDYRCDAIAVGKVAEIVIPDCIDLASGPVMFGITAVDRKGNESDMTTLTEPFHRQAPPPPQRLCLEHADAFMIREALDEETIEPEIIQRLIAQLEDDEPPEADPTFPDGEEEDTIPARFDIGSIF